MKRKNATRNALLTSVLSLLLCVSMLVGATFAWFTDEVKSGTNVIAAGNLDIELEYAVLNDDGTVKEWKTVNDATNLFTGNLWEPGHTEVVYLRLSNLGTLALKYHLGINIVSETEGTNVAGATFKLSDHIYMGVVENVQPSYTSREAAIAAAQNGANGIIGNGYAKSGSMTADADELYMAVVVYMPTTVGNEANYMTGTARPEINLGINLFATQLENESDSFGPDYDKGAAWAGEVGEVPAEVDGVITITSAGELAAFAADVNSGNNYEGKTVKLGANIDLNNVAWTPIGNSTNKFNGTFIGTGYTISNLYVTGAKGVGLFGYTWTSAHIEGVTIDGAYVSGNDYVGAILGSGYLSANCIKDCTVKGAKIIATPYLMDNGIYDGGAKAGAIVGSAYNGNLTGNKAIDCTITAYRDLGGIAGMLYADGVTGRTLTASGNTVENVTLAYFDLNGAAYEGNKVNENMGDAVGRLGRSSEKCNMPVVENNTATNVTRKSVITWVDNGVQYTKDVDAGVVTLLRVTEKYTSETLAVPSGVTALASKILQGNTTVKEVIIPSGLTDFGGTPNAAGTGASGGFFYGSAVEKVTLPEGLIEIPAAAFNGANNLKEVNIPSTVTTIGINAFAYTAMTSELVIPETVTHIGYGAFRGMTAVETIIVEGNPVVDNYAFRSCPNLTTIKFLGTDVTFTGTSQLFCRSDDGLNMDLITLYVANEKIAERVAKAQSTTTGYKVVCEQTAQEGGYYTDTEGNAYTYDTDALKAAVNDTAVDKIVLAGNDAVTVEDISYLVNREVTISGGTLSRDSGNGNPLTVTTTEKVTFDDVKFESVKGGAVLATRTPGANVELNDCVFENLSSPSTGNVGIQVYANNATFTFNNCTFSNMPIVTNSSYPEGIKLVFNNCTFTWTGDNCPGMIQLANYVEADIDINDCKFIYTTNSQYTTKKNMISTYASVGTTTIDFNNFEVIGTRNNDNIWTLCGSGKNLTITATGTLSYTFNGNVIDFATYLK